MDFTLNSSELFRTVQKLTGLIQFKVVESSRWVQGEIIRP